MHPAKRPMGCIHAIHPDPLGTPCRPTHTNSHSRCQTAAVRGGSMIHAAIEDLHPLDFGLVQLCPHAFYHRVSRKQKLAGSGFPANVGEAEKVECFRLPRATLALSLVGELSK